MNEIYEYPTWNKYRCLWERFASYSKNVTECISNNKQPYKIEACLFEIDTKYQSFFKDKYDYFILGVRKPPVVIKEPYKYPSDVTLGEIEEYVCKNKTQN